MNREQRWRTTWAKLSVPTPNAEVFAAVCSHYDESARAYHNLNHIDECFGALDECGVTPLRPGELEFAIWMHDVIYDSRRNDNEEQSAAEAVRLLSDAGAEDTTVAYVHDLIMATKTHIAETDDGRLLVDIDLAILSAPEERFDEYESQIREEYQWVEWSRYREGRLGVLETFLKRGRIYSTTAFAERESAARDNLQHSVRKLKQ